MHRESRARRRHVIADSDDSDEEETETPPVVVDAWMDWSNMVRHIVFCSRKLRKF